MYSGLLILAGLITFVVTEKIFSFLENQSDKIEESCTLNNNTKGLTSSDTKTDQASDKKHVSKPKKYEQKPIKQ